MNSSTPMICGIALTAMISAATSHWWTIGHIAASAHTTPLPHSAPAKVTAPMTLANHTNQPALKTASPAPAAPDLAQKEFYEALISKMARMEGQNRDLLDQLAETNRDLMKLEFRVDTHSESFRPMPVSEDQPFSTLNSETSVLPPRAQPVSLPNHE